MHQTLRLLCFSWFQLFVSPVFDNQLIMAHAVLYVFDYKVLFYFGACILNSHALLMIHIFNIKSKQGKEEKRNERIKIYNHN